MTKGNSTIKGVGTAPVEVPTKVAQFWNACQEFYDQGQEHWPMVKSILKGAVWAFSLTMSHVKMSGPQRKACNNVTTIGGQLLQ
jgi:hypothetical protein